MNERIGYPDFIKNESKLNEKYEKVRLFVVTIHVYYIIYDVPLSAEYTISRYYSTLKKITKKYYIQN